MSVLSPILVVLLVLACLLIILLVLMQRPRQEGLGAAFGGDMTSQMWGSRATDVLQKGTVYMGVALFIIALSLAAISAKEHRDRQAKGTELDKMAVPEAPPAPAPTPAEANSTPVEVKPGETPATPAPTTPATPETPAPATPAEPTPAPAEPAPATPVEPAPATPAEPAPATPAEPAPTTPAPAEPAPAPSGN